MRKSGSLISYLRKLERGLKNEQVEVPCAGCTACCRDPAFEADVSEEEAKRYKASRRISSRYVLDRQADGSCVYLIDGKCSTYHDRPRTCRVYDCRYHLFGAPLHDDCTVMQEAVAQWDKFTLPTMEDKVAMVAITVMVMAAVKQDPNLTGLAFMLLDWRKFRAQAYDLVQEMQVV